MGKSADRISRKNDVGPIGGPNGEPDCALPGSETSAYPSLEIEYPEITGSETIAIADGRSSSIRRQGQPGVGTPATKYARLSPLPVKPCQLRASRPVDRAIRQNATRRDRKNSATHESV